MLIGPFSPNILSGHFGPKIGSRTFILLLEALQMSTIRRNQSFSVHILAQAWECLVFDQITQQL